MKREAIHAPIEDETFAYARDLGEEKERGLRASLARKADDPTATLDARVPPASTCGTRWKAKRFDEVGT